MLFKKCLSAIIGLISLPMLLFAQETTSEIHGQVKDGQTGVPGAVVIALHNPTGTKYMTTTRKDGRYNVPNVRVGGPYTISVSYIGYKDQKIENVILSLGQEYTGDFNIVPDTKQLNEVVVKSGKQDKTFNNNRTGAQEIISRDQLEKLPTINRSAQDFTRLEPTASNPIGGQSFGGRSNQYNNFTVDGANFNNSFGLSGTLGGQAGAQPISLDAIDQIQVNIAPYDVRQGGFSGAGVNTVTKSGTNTFRGSVYTYFKNENTQGYKVGNVVVPKTDLSFSIRGASIGGPIIKNKLFFFVNGESSRQTAPATSWIPSDASHAPNPGGVSTANADTLAALATFLKDTYGYDPGAYSGYSFKTNSDKITAKIDWNINDHNTLTLKYNYLKSMSDQFASTSRPAGATGGQPGFNAMPFYGSGYVINNNFNIFIAELNTRFGNAASNKFQVGYTALRDYRTPHSSSTTMPLVDILNNGNIYTTFGYEPYTYNNTLNTDVFQISDIFTFYKGAHEITVGTQDYYRKYKNAFAPGYQGAYQFASLTDFYNSAKNGALNAKSYYLQYSALSDGSFPWAYAGSTELGLFAQDKWRVSNNFTLTYGLRFDMTIYKQDFEDNPQFNALKFKDGKSYDIGKAPGNALLVSPRIGFNWDVLDDKTLQVRGGLGIFSGPPPFVWISNQASNNGVQWGSFTKNGVAFSADPNAYRPESASANTAYAVALTDKNFKYPSVLKTSLAVDKKLPGDWVFTVEGTYSKDINAVYFQNINLNETNGYALSNGGDNRMRYNTSLTTSLNTSNKYYSAGTSLADPNIGNAILMSNTSKGYAYNITGRVQKTYKNLYVSVAYTHGDARNVAETGSTASSLWSARAVSADPNAANLTYASYRLPNRIIAMASYKVSYAKYFATSFGLIYEAAPAGVTSYTYNGDLNGDGFNNDLMYIPTNDKDINLINVGSYNATTHTGSTTGTANDPRTAAQIWTQLNNFINQSDYLSSHRGQVAKANAVTLPFFKKADVNITEDISVKTGKERHTLRLSLDIINVGNLLNKNWGIVKSTTVTNPLKFEGIAADGKTPLFSFPYSDASNQVHYSNSFANNTGITSRWQMQFGVRYIFN
ncbi:TonB-dependent receptor [Chitinophaga filiformis]|uniref:Carboxypeptidase regulatory-like domain-containing protein n=1 Tax=Chitinophaga filiformis TaxID=104663 RepID=A0A1G7TVS6_CHIFI|nr:carboxypeptidase regulatory-like domain-containing protein [Chitinophaga filiformis]SDG39437.1 Carboxypeptidase regulatory-like domain-containing protein [Chitinophaga filiformis]